MLALAALVACATASPGPTASTAGAPLPLEKAATQAAPQPSGFITAYRRLTESQYRNAIADTFGAGVRINARFEPERREEGLQAVGAARLSITTSGLEQYYAVARSVADQVVDGRDRDAAIGCKPEGLDQAARDCVERFIARRGLQLFRRPLSADETARFLSAWQASARGYGDFHKALKLTLVDMLMSPDFLFRVERAEADPQRPSDLRLDGYTKAARLSYMLWNAGPDEALLEAARTGAIHSPARLASEVDRLLASPRFEDGVRAFFTDMLEFEAFENLSKDAATYPKFSQAVADSAREETLRFLVHHLVKAAGDYRDVFTSRDTFIDRTLAYVYDVPYLSSQRWAPYTFPEASERSGLLTQATFLSLFAHPGRSSPTIRGVRLNEIFLCVQIPQPPPDVDFSKVQAVESGTVRTRLLEHMTNPGCTSCHQISDPVGLSLERFDGIGQHRLMENAAPIDVSVQMGASSFSGAQGLGRYLHDSSLVPSCLVRKVHAYGVGRTFDPADADYLKRQGEAFAAGGYRLPALMRGVLTDPQFYRVVTPQGLAPNLQVASLPSGGNPILGAAR